MTINGLFIFFLIPIFCGFSHLYSKTLLHKKKLINFFLILSIISTVYYHHKYISKRDTLLLRNIDLNSSVNASIIDEKLKNLRWITHHYPLNPEKEIEYLRDTLEIIKKDNRIKMIVTDYQFIPITLSMKDFAASRIWWRHHIYPAGADKKYFLEWKEFLLNQINKRKIQVIYTVHPLEGEKNIFQGLISKDCYSSKKLSDILEIQMLQSCEDLNFSIN